MVDYYGNRPYGSSYVYRDNTEYPGYDSSWVLGRERDTAYIPRNGYHYSPNVASRQSYPSTRVGYLPDNQYDRSGRVRLAWATEIPTTMRASICCDGCRMKLEDALRDMHGVHDVGITGMSNAVVTVTGTASPNKLVQEARKYAQTAELWDETSDHGSHYSHNRYY